jgi:pantothenate kinase type III
MILCIDVGNTNTVFALLEGDRLVSKKRISTRRDITSDELEIILGFFLRKVYLMLSFPLLCLL